MTIHYLKFANKGEAYSKLLAFTTLDENGDRYFVKQSPTHALDDIGIMYREPAKNELGEPTEAPKAKEGYHVNLEIDSLPEDLQAYETFPETPSRTWWR